MKHNSSRIHNTSVIGLDAVLEASVESQDDAVLLKLGSIHFSIECSGTERVEERSALGKHQCT
jgi:hypothetical protein